MRTHAGALPALVAVNLLFLTADATAAPASEAGRVCRSQAAKQTKKLAKRAFELIDACHKKRDRGAFVGDCNDLDQVPDTAIYLETARNAAKAIDAACAGGASIGDLYSGQAVSRHVTQRVADLVEANAGTLQGAPELGGDAAGRRCHRALGKVRSKLVKSILRSAFRCEKAADRQAAVLGPARVECGAPVEELVAKVRDKLVDRCGDAVIGPEVGSCAVLPECLIERAREIAADLAAVPFGSGSCGDGFRARGEQCTQLEGGAAEIAREAVRDIRRLDAVDDSEIEDDGTGEPVVRTRLSLWIAEGALVDEVNAALASVGAEIISSVEGLPVLYVSIPDPGSASAAAAVVGTLASHPAISSARLADLPGTEAAPIGYDFSDEELHTDLEGRLDHHLAVRAHAAWHLQEKMAPVSKRPVVVVGDFFGDARPTEVELVFENGFFEFAKVADPDRHGYHVVGILAGSGAGPCVPGLDEESDRSCVVGMLPGPTEAHAADLVQLRTFNALNLEAIRLLKRVKGNAIYSTSLSFRVPQSLATARKKGGEWAAMVREATLEEKFVHLTSAGNIDPASPADTQARLNSYYTSARLLPDLEAPDGSTISFLRNVLPVENVQASFLASPPEPSCLSDGSKRGGLLSGIGVDVWSFLDAEDTSGELSGTSMATPQVAGLAAYLWSLDPEMSVAQLTSALRGNAEPVASSGELGCSTIVSAPLIDAYASVLSLDHVSGARAGRLPMRLGLLDRDRSEIFDERDVEQFLIEWFDGFAGAALPGVPRRSEFPTYARGDLAGDGFSDVFRRASFDLERSGSTRFGGALLTRVVAEIDGEPRLFDEASVSDLEILCFYAHSPLFEGKPRQRDAVLDPSFCNPMEVTVDLPLTLEAGTEESFSVKVETLSPGIGGVERRPRGGLRIELAAEGGSLSSDTASTDAAGQAFAGVVGATPGEAVKLVVTVRDEPGGTVLARETSFAIVEEPVSQISLSGRWIGSGTGDVSTCRSTSSPADCAQLSISEQGGGKLFIRSCNGSFCFTGRNCGMLWDGTASGLSIQATSFNHDPPCCIGCPGQNRIYGCNLEASVTEDPDGRLRMRGTAIKSDFFGCSPGADVSNSLQFELCKPGPCP